MKGLLLFLLTVFGIVLAGLGLLFLVASPGHAYRLAVAAVGLAGGAACIGAGIKGLRALARRSPEAVREEILAEARRRSGTVSETDLAALLGERWRVGDRQLRALMEEGACRRKVEAGSVLYLFPELQARMAVRRCEHCSAELPIGQEIATCPNCGGTLKTSVERVTVPGDTYRMDD